MIEENKNLEIWLTNITDQYKRIYDLGIGIKPLQTLDLMKLISPTLTIEQIENSIYNGSIAKNDKIFVITEIKPKKLEKKENLVDSKHPLIRPIRSIVHDERKRYEELTPGEMSIELGNLLNSEEDQ